MAPAGTMLLCPVVVFATLLLMAPALRTCPRSCNCPSPGEVHCTFRHLTSVPPGLPEDTERVNLGYNSIQVVRATDFAKLSRLQMLMLHGNDITSVTPGAFRTLRSLQILKLSYNKLQRLGRSLFDGLWGLVRLHLDHNTVEVIEPLAFSGLTALRLLQLDGNRLRELHPSAFITLSFLGHFRSSSLRYLHLAENQLQYLPPGTLQHLPRLEVLSLHGNPWSCDCQLHWLMEWNSRNQGVIKCKKERGAGLADVCAACSTPQHLNGSHVFQLSPGQVPCERPRLRSPLKLKESTVWDDAEPDLPYTNDLEPPLGLLTFTLSDSHGNQAHVSCAVKRPDDGSSVSWESLKTPGWVAVNVSLVSQLECDIDREELQKLWRLVAYYYESPAVLERGQKQENSSRNAYQYVQAAIEDSPYFTELKGQLTADPVWLLQPRVTLQLNRRRTTTKKLVLNFSTFISQQVSSQREAEANQYTWAMIQRDTPERVQAILEGSDSSLHCKVTASGDETLEWILPDLSILNSSHPRLVASEHGVLLIRKASLSDSGLYHCLVRTERDMDVVSFRVTVRELLLSPESMNGQAMSVETGEPLALPCSVSSVEPSRTSWFLPGNRILHSSPTQDRVFVATNGTLIIRMAAPQDAGEYSCLASNLYGVDMLSHVIVVTGSKSSQRAPTVDPVEHVSLKSMKSPEEDPEGNGSGFQEIKRPVPARTPPRTSGRLHGSGGSFSWANRVAKAKDGKKTSNKSVKELDPSRWAQMLAKAHAKTTSVPPPPTLTSAAETASSRTTPATTTTPTITTLAPTFPLAATTATVSKYHTTAPSYQSVPPEISTTRPVYHGSNDINIPKPPLLHSKSATATRTGSGHVTPPSPQQVTQLEKSKDGRRRPPFRRRRPPQRRIQPISSFLSAGEAQDTIGEPITTNTKEKSKMNSGNPTPARDPTTLSSSNKLIKQLSNTHFSPVIEQSTHVKPKIPPQTVQILQRTHLSFDQNTRNAPSAGHRPSATQAPELMEETGKEHTGPVLSSIKYHNQAQLLTTKGINFTPIQFNPGTAIENLPVETKMYSSSAVTQTAFLTEPVIWKGGAAVTIPSIPPNRSTAHKPFIYMEKDTRQNFQSNSSNQADVSKWKHPLHSASSGSKDSSVSKSKSPHASVLPVNHPWSQHKHFQKKVYSPNTQPPSTSPTSWVPPNRFAAWPSLYNPRLHPPYSHGPWHSPRHVGRGAGVTNGPEITALTVKPTPFPLEPVPSRTSHPPPSTSAGRTKDHNLLLSRLRNRHRQSQINSHRLSQLGRLITPKPQISSPTPKPQEAPIPPRGYSPVTLAPFPSHTDRPQYTVGVLHGNPWHHPPRGHGKLSTAPPFLQPVGSGAKPRINSANVASVSVLAEADVALPCQASGEPEPVLSWTKVSTGATIHANSRHGQRFGVHRNGTFVIQNVQLQDRGQYLCTAHNKFGSDRMAITLAVLTEPPKIVAPLSRDVSVYLGKAVSLDCTARGRPRAQVSWILPDRTFLLDTGISGATAALLLANGTLRIQAANFSSKGDYKCIASNAAGADTVTYHVHVAAVPPAVGEELSERMATQAGRSVYVHCTVTGEPPPALKWSLPSGAHIRPSQFLGGRLFAFPNGTLYVRSALPTDSGRYECSATNTVGTAKRVVQLDITQEAASPRYGPAQQHRVTAMYGSTVYLHCPESMGSQRGALWRLPSKTLLDHRYSPDRPVTAFSNGTLRIQQLTEKDAGNYLCMFHSSNVEDMELFQVELLMKPPKIEHLATASKKVIYGANFQVDCVASGLPDPEVSWSLPDGTMISNALQSDDSGTRSRRYVIFGNGTLILQQMDKRDEGDYTCYAKNKLGEDEMKVNVKVVQDSPRILSKDQVSYRGRLGEPAHIKCEARGDPAPTIIWISPSNDIISSSIRYQVLDDGTLVIKKVSLADRGKYTCVARNSVGDDIRNVQLEVETQKPQINGKEGKSSVKVLAVSYQTKMLDCKVEGMPLARVTWTTSHGTPLPVPYQGGRFQVHSNGSLELRGLRKTDEGRFICEAKNDLGEAVLEVELEVSPLAEKPSFAMPNIEVLPLKADAKDITLECPARGKPAPDFVWVLPNGTALDPGTSLQRFLHYLGNGTLRILQPVTNDKGVYRCLAKNSAGQAEKRYALELGKKPQIRGMSGPVKVPLGQNLNLPCAVDAWPLATISWTLPSGMIMDKPQVNGRVTLSLNGTLQVRETITFDRGIYSCKATNSFGLSTASYPVAVMVYPPHITSSPPSILRVSRGSSVTLNCVAVGTPKPDISWTLPGRTTLVPSNRFASQGAIHMTVEGSLVIQNPVLMNSGIYKCNAKNALGTDFKATYLQVI